MNIKDLVKGKTVKFVEFDFLKQCSAYWEIEEMGGPVFLEAHDGAFYFEDGYVELDNSHGNLIYSVEDTDFIFHVPFVDLKGGRFKAEDKAIFFMRWIRKQFEANQKTNIPKKVKLQHYSGYSDELENDE